MSVNVSTDDLVTREIGDGDDRYKHLMPPRVDITMPNDGGDTTLGAELVNGRISSVRRTFCLFVTFDLGLCFILWVIYTQLIGDTGWKAFQKQVEDYTFQHSLFDTVMMAAVRFTFLLLAYALFRLKHWWTVATTTFLSSAFLLCKVFLYDFGDSAKNPLSYCVLIVSFTLAWVETWFLDFKVLPWERKQLMKLNNAGPVHSYGSLGVGDRRRLLPDDALSTATFDQYYSPVGTPEGSDTEDEPGARGSRAVIPQHQIAEYRQLQEKSWNFLWQCITCSESEWKLQAGKSKGEDGLVYSRQTKDFGKIFKLEGEVEMDAESLWKDMVFNINTAPSWNPTLVECNTVAVIDDCTDISYNIAAGVGGVVSSRDFINLRHWGKREGLYLSAGHGVTHPDRPATKKHVRGYNGPGGWAFRPVEGDPNRCIFIWIMNLDLKGWMPQRIVDQAMTTVLQDYLKYLRRHVAESTHL